MNNQVDGGDDEDETDCAEDVSWQDEEGDDGDESEEAVIIRLGEQGASSSDIMDHFSRKREVSVPRERILDVIQRHSIYEHPEYRGAPSPVQEDALTKRLRNFVQCGYHIDDIAEITGENVTIIKDCLAKAGIGKYLSDPEDIDDDSHRFAIRLSCVNGSSYPLIDDCCDEEYWYQ